MEHFRNTYKEKIPSNKSVSVIGKADGAKWKSMSNAVSKLQEKAPFVTKAEKKKAEYNKEKAPFVAKAEKRRAEYNKGHAQAKTPTVNQQIYAEFHIPALGNTQTFTPIRNLSPRINSMNFSGLPSHKLIIKEECRIILTRNINPRAELCNGTRLICHNYSHNVITVEIVSGSCKGKKVFIPRISQKPSSDMELPLSLRAKQFPIQLLR